MSGRSEKLAASIGLALGWTSWQALLVGTFTGFALAAFYGGALLAMQRATRTSQLPLGPFILLGALAAIAVLRWQIELTGLSNDPIPARRHGTARLQCR